MDSTTPLGIRTLAPLRCRAAAPGVLSTGAEIAAAETVGAETAADRFVAPPVPGGTPPASIPAGVPVASAAASLAAAAPAAPLAILGALHSQGFHLLYRRRFWLPFLRAHRVELPPAAFADQMSRGSRRLEVASDDFRPAGVRGPEDLAALATFYLGGTPGAIPHAPLVTALNSLYRSGFTFTRRGGRVGPYGAWRVLVDGGARWNAPVAGQLGAAPEVLHRADDAYRAQFFRVGGTGADLSHPREAATLKALARKGATLWIEPSGGSVLRALEHQPRQAERVDGETAYRRLFQDRERARLEVGAPETPLVAPPDLADAAACLQAFDVARMEYQQILATGVGSERGRPAWELVRPSVAGEALPERLQWLRALLACEGNAANALDAYRFLSQGLRPGDAMTSAVKDFTELREALDPRQGHGEARQCYLRLRDHMDRALPGPEAPDEKRAMYLQLLQPLRTGAAVEHVWRKLDGAAPRPERVGVFLDLLGQEQNHGDAAEQAFHAVVRCERPGEGLLQAAQAFKRILAITGPGGGAVPAYEFIREKLDASLPGPQTHDEKARMFTDLLGATKSFSLAHDLWNELRGRGAAPPADFADREAALLALIRGEGGDVTAARADLRTVLAAQAPGESVVDTRAEFSAVRQRLGDGRSEAARQGFAFLRHGADHALAGPWTPDQKRELYLKLLSELGDHGRSLQYWHRLSGVAPPADFPQRVDAFVALCALEHRQFDEAARTLDVVMANRRPSESLPDAVTAFAALRGKLSKYDAAGGREAFLFVRHDLAGSLPGPWTDAQRTGLYGRLLDATHSQTQALSVWRELAGKPQGGALHPPVEFPQLLDGFVALLPGENGDADEAMTALNAVRDVAAQVGGPAAVPGLVSDYQTLRPLVDRYATTQGAALFKFVHLDLSASERGAYLKLQRACGDFSACQEAWKALTASPQDLDERVSVLVDCVKKEDRNLALAREELDAILETRRPNERITQSAASLDQLRIALPRWDGSSILTAYRFMRGHAGALEEPLFVSMLKDADGMPVAGNRAYHPLSLAISTWTALRQAGDGADFDARAQALLSQPPQWWNVVLARLRAVPSQVPVGVDRVRGERALVRLATVHDEAAPHAVLKRLDATPGLDRTTALEWLCAMMAEAGGVRAFEQGWQDVHRPGAPGTVAERQLLMANLVESTRASSHGFTAALDILRRLDRMPAPAFAATANSAVALATAMPGHAGDAARALIYILDARDQGRLGNASLDDCIARFATGYAASGSLESALAGLEQHPSGGTGGIQRQDGDVIIGGIRVPRTPAQPPPESTLHAAMRAWDELRKRFWSCPPRSSAE